MKSGELKRTGGPKRKPKKRIFKDFERLAKAMFRDAAREQMVCAICDKGGPYDAHHVVAKQELKRRGLFLWDPRNALRVHRDCHLAHENKMNKAKIKRTSLMPDNIEYAYEVLGDAAENYLRRHYA